MNLTLFLTFCMCKFFYNSNIMAFTRCSHSKLCWVAWWICSWCWHCGLRRVSIWEAAKSSEQFSMWVTFSHGSVNLEYLEETADGQVGREREKQGLQEAANTLKIFSIRIEARMQQSNAMASQPSLGPMIMEFGTDFAMNRSISNIWAGRTGGWAGRGCTWGRKQKKSVEWK